MPISIVHTVILFNVIFLIDVLGLKIIPFRQQTVLLGTHASYTCDASSGTVLWYKVQGSDSILLPSTRFPEIKVVPDRIYESRKKDLVFTNANFTHSGRYKCELSAQSIIMKKVVFLAVSGKCGFMVSSLLIKANFLSVILTFLLMNSNKSKGYCSSLKRRVSSCLKFAYPLKSSNGRHSVSSEIQIYLPFNHWTHC